MMHEKPARPWIKIGTDLFIIYTKVFLIISDYFSRYPIVKELDDAKASTVVKCTKKVLAMFGTVHKIVCDYGPCFQKAYKDFCDAWDIKHTTSSPRYAHPNGFIERQIR